MSRISQTRRKHSKHARQERQFRRTGYVAAINAAFSGVGDGVLSDLSTAEDAPAETWTITFTDATNFGVVGSVSGAQTAGVVGTPYLSDAGEIGFLITAGGTPFAAADAFTFDVDAVIGNQGDLVQSRSTNFFSDQSERIVGVDSVGEVFEQTKVPGLVRSNEFTTEDIEDATDPSDIGLT